LRRAALFAAIAGIAGCYAPSVERCLYQCSANDGCPNSLTCNNDHWCASSKTDTCEEIPDAPSQCGWSVANIDACALKYDEITADFIVDSAGPVMIDTDAADLPNGVQGGVMDQLGLTNAPALVMAVHDLTVSGTLNVQGKRPLIILASGTVTISGEVNIAPSADDDALCAGRVGDLANTIDGAGGGGGGSMGSGGAMGGDGGQQANGPGGAAMPGQRGVILQNELMLTPLRGGCRGGTGGGMGTNPGGRYGFGGGAIQISARTRIAIDGRIAANGGGGLAKANTQYGGGGGGSGGAILLQSPMVTITGARLCANGGGGAGSFGLTGNGGVSDCGPVPAPGGNSGTSFDNGGSGAAGTTPAGPGVVGTGTTAPTIAHGGGGGGGGLGRIRILGAVTTTGTPLISPAYGP
jgi:hypothetical protein